MPDIREISLLMPEQAGRFRWGKFLSRIKFRIRWMVVATSRTPLRYLYRAIYKAHIAVAVGVARRFPQTKAVYVARSVGRGEIALGVSDIDIVVVGAWPEPEQIRLMRRLGALTAFSPLYDSGMWQQVHTEAALRNLWETDYFFQSRFNEGRGEWKLELGHNIVSELPPMPIERLGGGCYMEVRSWWLHFIASAFGSGPTAQDAIFRNSISYKSVTEMMAIVDFLRTGRGIAESRKQSLRRAIDRSKGEERDFLERLEQSAEHNHLHFSGDIQQESLRLLLPLLDQIHAELRALPSFASVGDFQVDAQPDELLLTEAALTHAPRLAEYLKRSWPSYRATYLAPSTACFAMDELLLLIEIDPTQLPDISQLRSLCQLHAETRAQVPQRIALYLLLPNGACQLEFVSFTEMWRVLIFPASNPDLFALLRRPEFLIDGTPHGDSLAPVWSRFAYDVALEEVNVRRSVLSRVTPDVFPSSIEIIRNVWRHLQLEVLVRTAAQGSALLALSPAAVSRGLRALDRSEDTLLQLLEDAYREELAGRRSDVRPLIPRIMAYLTSFH
ncbi:MAG: hypothetical protein ABSF22_10690 [Bryobacteraceae bacterium]